MALAAGSFSSAPTIAFAKAAIVGTQAPSFYRLKLGDYEITALSDGTAKLPMSKIHRNIAEDEAEAYLQGHFQAGSAEISVNAFLVNTGEPLFLIDAGTGDLLGPSLGKLVSNIQAAGYTPSQIDRVIAALSGIETGIGDERPRSIF